MRGARRKIGGGRGCLRRCLWATTGTRGGRGDRGLRHGWRGTRWGGAALVTVPAASPGAKEAGLLGCHRNRRAHGAWSGPGELHPKAGWARVAWPRGIPGGDPANVIRGGGTLSGLSLPGCAKEMESNLGHPEKAQGGNPTLSHQDGGDTPRLHPSRRSVASPPVYPREALFPQLFLCHLHPAPRQVLRLRQMLGRSSEALRGIWLLSLGSPGMGA